MQPPTHLDDLQQIISAVHISPDGQISFHGKPYQGYDYPEASVEARIFHNLSNLLYSACYTRAGLQDEVKNLLENPDSDISFLSALRDANASTEHYDCGWIVEEIEQTGSVVVRKGGNKRHTYAGDFIREHFAQGPLQRGEQVNLKVVAEYGADLQDRELFYHVFGKTLLDNNNSFLVRLYFHLSPEGAKHLIALISRRLNDFSIPFQFKCINRPDFFTRCDTAVLYIDKRYFEVVTELLAEGYPDLKPYLKHDLPMFTKVLAPGIGFAENPFSSGESFGTSRCKIIAQGIVNAWKSGYGKELWQDFILQNLQKHFLRPDALHLNPNSNYPYQSPVFEN